MMTVAHKFWKSCDNDWKKSVLYSLNDYDGNKPFVTVFNILVSDIDILKLFYHF